jgi:ADP-ribosylation factor-like protein 6
VAKNELDILLEHDDISKREIPILFFANKMDLPMAMTEQEVAKELSLDKITDRPWHIQASSAVKGFGVNEGISWLTEIIMRNKKK